MEAKEIPIWRPIAFQDNWLEADTSELDELVESWYKKREEFEEGSKEYREFLERLKRQHAIETGVIERLYDLNEGITETFIKEGFVENYISHQDTNISPAQLMGYLRSHLEAIDFVFDVIKENRPLTKSFILALHQLVMQHQAHSTAIDSLGRTVQVKVLKGKFKERPNNPKREDGTVFMYCPPEHVDSEMERLLDIYEELEEKNVHPVIIASWFHHAFTQIHPFQDGNGRMARLLTSLIFIKHRLFPLNIKRDEKRKYIKALESADKGNPDALVRFFCEVQRRNIELALNIRIKSDRLKEAAEILKEKVARMRSKQKAKRVISINRNREALSKSIYDIIGNIQKRELFKELPQDMVHIKTTASKEGQSHYYTYQIGEYAKEHGYFFNKNMERRWFRMSLYMDENKRYDIVITVHHFGYFDSVVAIGAFIEFIDNSHESRAIEDTIPLGIKPYTVSLEKELTERTKQNIESYLRDVITSSLSIIASEI